MVTGVQRYIANNYSDNDKNDCIKIILNRHICQRPYGIQNQIQQSMQEIRDRFETKKKIKIGVLTWNLAGRAPNPNMDISKLLLPE
jgi:hypothetical protein